jgi:hypothetical protein
MLDVLATRVVRFMMAIVTLNVPKRLSLLRTGWFGKWGYDKSEDEKLTFFFPVEFHTQFWKFHQYFRHLVTPSSYTMSAQGGKDSIIIIR